MLGLLRNFQRDNKVPAFGDFCKMALENCSSPGQSGPLEQRLGVLRQFVKESDDNIELLAEQRDLEELIGSGCLVVADLTDPMLAPDEANGTQPRPF